MLDILAGTIELYGKWITGNKNKWGWMLQVLCSILWISYALINKHTYGLLIICIPALFVNARNFTKWRKEENELG